MYAKTPFVWWISTRKLNNSHEQEQMGKHIHLCRQLICDIMSMNLVSSNQISHDGSRVKYCISLTACIKQIKRCYTQHTKKWNSLHTHLVRLTYHATSHKMAWAMIFGSKPKWRLPCVILGANIKRSKQLDWMWLKPLFMDVRVNTVDTTLPDKQT